MVDVTKQKMDELVDRGLVQSRTRGDLTVYKYKNKVFYDDLWDADPALIEARGIVFDDDGYIVQRPLKKVFNDGERGRTPLPDDTPVIASQKVNGFMAAVTMYQGDVIVSTTGSLDSPFVQLASKYLRDNPAVVNVLDAETTLIFEICDPDDAHIIDERQGAYLLAMRDKVTGDMYQPGRVWDLAEELYMKSDICILPVKYESGTMHHYRQEVQDRLCDIEGYMLYDYDTGEPLTKLKSIQYLSIKAMQRLGRKQIEDMFCRPKVFRQRLDEEFFDLHEFIIENWTQGQWAEMDEAERNDLMRCALLNLNMV